LFYGILLLMKIGPRLLLSFVFIAILPLAFAGLLIFYAADHIITENVLSHLATIAQTQEARINMVLERDISRLKDISRQPKIVEAFAAYARENNFEQKARIRELLQDAQNVVSRFKSITLVGIDAKVIVSTNRALEGKDYSQKQEFIKGRESVFVNFFPKKNIPLQNIAMPMFTQGKATAVLVVESDTGKDIEKILKDYPSLGQSGETSLARKNSEGEIEFLIPRKFERDPSAGRRLTVRDTDVPVVQAILKNEKTFGNSRDYRGVKVLAATHYLDLVDCGLVAKIDKAEAMAPARKLMGIILGVIFATLLVVTLVSLVLMRSITRPIHLLHEGTEIVGEGNLDYKVGTSTQDEIGQLSRAFDTMAENLKKTTASKAELEAAHEQLKAARAQIIQTVKMAGVGQLAASVAHEINNPLCFVMNNAELLKSGGKNVMPGSAEFKESVDAILDGARRIKNITHALLDFARLNAKEPTQINLNEIVEKSLYLVYPETRNACTIEKDLSSEQQVVNGNGSELMQVVINLLLNAYQASRQRGMIKISTYSQENFVVVEVRDNGIGIEEKIMAHIFEPFFTTKKPGEGTGLGLSTSREIIKKHGGEINITSKAGEGTTVKVLLPRCQKSDA